MDLESIDAFMAIGAHCDDVDLRTGGTFARLVREGKRGCYVVTVENPYVGKHWTVADSREALRIRREESTRAAGLLGAERLEWLQFKGNYQFTPEAGSHICPTLDSPEQTRRQLEGALLEGLPPLHNAPNFPRCRRRLAELIRDFRPQLILTHSPDDRHPDHYGVARFVDFMVRELRGEGERLDVLFWEPGSGMPIVGFRPDFFVELSEEDVATKQKALGCYESQMAPGMLDGFAAARTGAYGALVGLDHAEAFQTGPCPQDGAWQGRCAYFERLEGDREPQLYRLP
jgi:LmbE family N-acetylglucosaminyl deacetylase